MIRVAVVGTGRMARLHLQALRRVSIPHAVVAVYDANPTAAADFAQLAGARVYESLGELLEAARPQIVHVCTPAGTPNPVGEKARGSQIIPFTQPQDEVGEIM